MNLMNLDQHQIDLACIRQNEAHYVCLSDQVVEALNSETLKFTLLSAPEDSAVIARHLAEFLSYAAVNRFKRIWYAYYTVYSTIYQADLFSFRCIGLKADGSCTYSNASMKVGNDVQNLILQGFKDTIQPGLTQEAICNLDCSHNEALAIVRDVAKEYLIERNEKTMRSVDDLFTRFITDDDEDD
jgi:hypothetical protein